MSVKLDTARSSSKVKVIGHGFMSREEYECSDDARVTDRD